MPSASIAVAAMALDDDGNLVMHAPPILVFDGGCVLCSRSVRWILRHERDATIRFAATQSPEGQKLLAQAGLDPRAPQSLLYIEAGQAMTRSQALIAIARHLRAPWRALIALGILPKGVRDALYDRIAHNRFRLFGRHDVCLVPNATDPARFLGASGRETGKARD